MRNKSVYDTLDGLILTGEKVREDAFKKPSLIPGFRNGEPRITTYFNITDSVGNREMTRKESLYLEPDFNAIMIFIKHAEEIWIKDDDNEGHMIVMGSKFTEDGEYTGEQEVKGVIIYGKKKGVCYLKTETPAGMGAYFPFRKPHKANFKEGGSHLDSTLTSKYYALLWLDIFKLSVSDMLVRKVIAKRRQ